MHDHLRVAGLVARLDLLLARQEHQHRPELEVASWAPQLCSRGRARYLATLGADGVWRRVFASGTSVTFDTKTNNGTVAWATLSHAQ